MKIISLILLLTMAQSPFSSTKINKSKIDDLSKQNLKKSINTNDSISKVINFYVSGDSICFVVNKRIFCVPKSAKIDYKQSLCGLYEINGNRLKKSYYVVLNQFIYFTTYDDIGRGHRGYLYVFDMKKKTLIKDLDANRNFLYSEAGIFIFDKKTNKVYSVSKSEWFNRKQIYIVYASMYSINGADFSYLKTVYEKSDDLRSDSSIVKFYDKTLANNAKHGLILPKGW